MKLNTFLTILGTVLLIFTTVIFAEAPPKTIFYQGLLRNDTGQLINGTYNLQFSLYDDVSAGNLEWGPEAHNNTTIKDGIFSVYLGSSSSLSGLAFDEKYWLLINVDGNDFSPRTEFSAAPYAFNAFHLDNQDSSYYARLSEESSFSGNIKADTFIARTSAGLKLMDNSSNLVLYVEPGGNVGLGTSSPGDSLQVQGNVLLKGNKGYNAAGETAVLYLGDINAHIDAVYNNGLRFSAYDAIDSLVLMEQSGNVGIGTISPNHKLDIRYGNVYIQGIEGYTGAGDTAVLYLGSTNEHIDGVYGNGLRFSAYGAADSLVLQEVTGNVGIGTKTPGDTLDVHGSASFNTASGNYDFKVSGDGDANLLYIDASADSIGIGTSTPEAKLHISGGELWVFDTGANPRLIVGDYGESGQYGYLQWDSDNDYLHISHSGSSNGVKLNNNNVSIGNIFPSQPLIIGYGTQELLRVTSSGNMGLGDNNPSDSMVVAGTVAVTGFEMATGATANYVLTTDGSGNASWQAAQGAGGDTDWTSNGDTMWPVANDLIVAADTIAGRTVAGLKLLSEDQTMGLLVNDTGQVCIGASDIPVNAPNAALYLSSANDQLVIKDSDGTADDRVWTMKADGGYLYFLTSNDAWSSWSEAMKIHRDGNSPDTINFSNGRVVIGDGYGQGYLHIKNTNDQLVIEDTDGAGDEKKWLFKADGGALQIVCADDAWTTWNAALQIYRSGNSITSFIFQDGSVVFNESGEDNDFRIEGDNDTKLFFVDASANNIGIGTTDPGDSLDVRGSAVFNENGDNYDFRVEGDVEHHLLMVDASSDFVGIRATTPDRPLAIVGSGAYNELISFKDYAEVTQWHINLYDTNSFNLAESNVADGRLYIKPGGFLGISTNDPQAMLDVRGSAIFNEAGVDTDFRIETDNEANMFFVDGSTDRVGVATNVPMTKFHVYENTATTDTAAGIQIEQDGAGDAILQLYATNAKKWTLGIDNSDNDFFKIGEGNDVGNNTKLTLGPNGGTIAVQTTFQGDVCVEDTLIFSDIQNAKIDFGYNASIAKWLGLDAAWYMSMTDDVGFRWYISGAREWGTQKMQLNSTGELYVTDYITVGDTIGFGNAQEIKIDLGTDAGAGKWIGIDSNWYHSTANDNGFRWYITGDRSSWGTKRMELNSTGDLTADGSGVFNEIGGDNDSRIEGDNDQNLIFVDASTDSVGIGTNTPSSKLDVNGVIETSSDVKALNVIVCTPLWSDASTYTMSNTSGADLSYCEAPFVPTDISQDAKIEVCVRIYVSAVSAGSTNFQLKAYDKDNNSSYPIINTDTWNWELLAGSSYIVYSEWKTWDATSGPYKLVLYGWVSDNNCQFTRADVYARPQLP